MGICTQVPNCGRCGQPGCVHLSWDGPTIAPHAECEGYQWPPEVPVPEEFQGEGGGFGGGGASGGW